MKTQWRKLLTMILFSLITPFVLAQGSESTHNHEHPAVTSGSEILAPLGEHGEHHLQVVEVMASDDGFAPNIVEVTQGEPLIVVFSNDTDEEHHFHILDLEPQDLSWFMVDQNHLETYDLDTLFSVSRAADHICDAASGICKLGINVHLHANPHSFDAVMFTAPQSGSFDVVCPLHAQMSMRFVVN